MFASLQKIYDRMRNMTKLGKNPLSVLIIDDESQVLRVLEKALQKDGFRVRAVSQGREGLEFILTEDFDLLLVDVCLADISAAEFVEELGRLKPAFLERLIFVTGNAYSDESQKLRELTNAAFLSKPFHLQELRDTVQTMLIRSRSQEDDE
jgi:DNA-binding response OmpR family regulator